MARRKEENEQLKAERKTEIRYAGLKLFAVKGYHATGVMDIAKEVGITHGTIYLYYQNKEEILVDLLTNGFTRMTSLVAAKLAESAGQSPLERLRHALRAIMIPTKDDAYFLRVAIQVYGLELSQRPALNGLNHRFWERLYGLLLPVVAVGQQDGSIRPGDPFQLVSLMNGAMVGYIVMFGDGFDFDPTGEGHDFDLRPHVDHFISLLSAR